MVKRSLRSAGGARCCLGHHCEAGVHRAAIAARQRAFYKGRQPTSLQADQNADVHRRFPGLFPSHSAVYPVAGDIQALVVFLANPPKKWYASLDGSRIGHSDRAREAQKQEAWLGSLVIRATTDADVKSASTPCISRCLPLGLRFWSKLSPVTVGPRPFCHVARRSPLP